MTGNKIPHLGEKIDIKSINNSELTFNILIDTKKHHYLYDHCFGGKALVPATMQVELFCESALAFTEFCENTIDPDLRIKRLENFEIERAIAIDLDKSLDIDFILKSYRKEENEIKLLIEIISKRINSKGKVIGTRLNAKASVILGKQPEDTEKVILPESIEYKYYNFPVGSYYDYYYPSHGPLFQSLTGRFAVDNNLKYLIGEYDCSDKERNFIKDRESEFVISPLGYDSTLQYAVFLARIQTLRGRLPIGSKKINIYKSHPKSGKCRVLVDCLSIDEDIMVSNIYAFDENNYLIMSAEEFKVQKAHYHKYDRKEFDEKMTLNQTDKFEW